jgi:ADP-dependent phosphofructokinase/glucokinase
VATEKGFEPAAAAHRDSAEAHHFVFENAETRTRFIASYDPQPLHPDPIFCSAIRKELPSIGKAFIGCFHLLPTPERLGKLAEELRAWKRTNPSLRLFLELGEFQSGEVRDALLPELSLFDTVGLNDAELSSFGMELDEFASHCGAVLFHTPEHSLLLPREKEDEGALAFAEKCASFRAKNGRCATLADLEGYETEFVENPVETVGLGDSFSCAYFLAAK